MSPPGASDAARSHARVKTNLGLLREALESGTLRQVRSMVHALHPAEIARLLESLPPPERLIVWELVADEDEGDILVELNDEVRARLVEEMDAEEVVAATEGMDLDDLADFVADLPEAVTQQVVRSLSQQDQDRLQAVLSFPEDSAGGLMDPETISVRPDVNLEVVLRYLRILGEIPDKTASVYVVDRNNHYLGVLYMTRLVTQDPESSVAQVMDATIEPISSEQPASEVATAFQDLDLVSAPVVDEQGRLIGTPVVGDNSTAPPACINLKRTPPRRTAF